MNKPGIIVYHQEDKLSVEEVASLQTFYQLDKVVFQHDLTKQLPDGTLAILNLDDGPLAFHGQDAGTRFIHINLAFEEMTQHVFNILQRRVSETDPYRVPLEEFIQHQKGEIFTLDDVFMHLGIDKTKDGADYAVPSIVKSLIEIGCIKENMLVFTPPRPGTQPQQKKQRFVEPFEIAT
ncbi:MAG: hypothetical protein K2P74_06915 [Nitrosomonas sp.]|nr:hypothetical protein [Nitrosomonas sp.]